MTMSLDSFYETLAGLGLNWSLYVGAIRCEDGHCPILAVYNANPTGKGLSWNASYAEAAQYLGLSHADTEWIVNAADYSDCNRERLLTACGL